MVDLLAVPRDQRPGFGVVLVVILVIAWIILAAGRR